MAKILIVDDQAAYVRSLVRALRPNFDLAAATSSDEAKASELGEIAVALVDIRLSEDQEDNREGLDLIRWLRQTHPHVSVVGMSALDEHELPQDVLEAGAVRFLSKPVTVSELMELLKELVGSDR